MTKNASWYDNLLDKFLDSVISQLVGVFVSVILVASFSYLAFQLNTDLIQTGQFEIDLKKQTAEMESFIKLGDIFNKGWFSKQSNWDTWNNYVKKLADIKQNPTLDPTLRQELIPFITSSQLQLAAELGQIQGIYFAPEEVKNYQDIMIDEYQQAISVFNIMEDMVAHWDNDSPEERTEHFQSIQKAMLQAGTDFKSAENAIESVVAYYENEQNKVIKAHDMWAENIRQIKLKRNLSVGVVAVVIIASFFVLIGLANKKKAEDKNKKRPSSPKKRK